MDKVIVHPRVTERHPELSEEDVKKAWRAYIRMMRREGDDDYYIAVGFDEAGRTIEMVTVETIEGDWYIYHAMTPPSKKTLIELGLMR